MLTFDALRDKLGYTRSELVLLLGLSNLKPGQLEKIIHQRSLRLSSHMIALDMLAELGLLPELRQRVVQCEIDRIAQHKARQVKELDKKVTEIRGRDYPMEK